MVKASCLVAFSGLLVLTAFIGYEAVVFKRASQLPEILEIQKYRVDLSQKLRLKRHEVNIGFGSGLKFQKEEDGVLFFWGLTDRGINYRGPKLSDGRDSTVFEEPKFKPMISLIEVKKNESATAVKLIELETTGLPPAVSWLKTKIPLNKKLLPIENYVDGIDSESLDTDVDGNFWVADEYLPSLVQFSPEGKMLRKILFNKGNGEILKFRQNNRGFESVAVVQDKIYAVVESVLDVNKETRNKANFIRFVEIDLKTEEIKTYAYVFDHDIYQGVSSVKVGDITAVNERQFLVIEQGVLKNGSMRHAIFLVDLNGATPIEDAQIGYGKALEYASYSELKMLIKPISRRLVFDAGSYGWSHSKLEGIAFIDDKRFALINDNDFGFDMKIDGRVPGYLSNYTLDMKSNQVIEEKTGRKIRYEIVDNGIPTELWVVEFKESFLFDSAVANR